MKRGSLLLAILALSACVDEEGAKQTAAAYGFRDVEVTGTSWFGCSRDDVYATAIEATNPQGDRVAAVVCSGGWGGKYGTLRIERILGRAASPTAVPLAR